MDNVLIFLLLILLVGCVHCALQPCCLSNVSLISSKYCQDGRPIDLVCEGNAKLEFLVSSYPLDLTGIDLTLSCSGPYGNNSQATVICLNATSTRDDADDEAEIFWPYDILEETIFWIHCVSFLGAFLTAYLYYWLPNLQDIHGTCIFHFSLNLALIHGLYVYERVFKISMWSSSGLCITNVHAITFVILSAYAWSIIVSYNTWKQCKGMQVINEERRLTYYRLFGYGVPSALIIIANVHSFSLYYETQLERRCALHGYVVILYYLAIPSFITPLINGFYFVDSQRKLWSSFQVQANSDERSSFLNRLKYKIYLNLKLCCVMNIPLTLAEVIFVCTYFDQVNVLLSFLFLVGLPSIEGLFVFLVLVVFRPRVLKGIAQYSRNCCMNLIRFPESWKNMNDSETVLESSFDGQEVDLTTTRTTGEHEV